MKSKCMVITILCCFLAVNSYGGCKELLGHYKRVPDPSIKTMKQLKRWVKRKIKDGNAKAVEECLVARAADNPNKTTVAGQ